MRLSFSFNQKRALMHLMPMSVFKGIIYMYWKNAENDIMTYWRHNKQQWTVKNNCSLNCIQRAQHVFGFGYGLLWFNYVFNSTYSPLQHWVSLCWCVLSVSSSFCTAFGFDFPAVISGLSHLMFYVKPAYCAVLISWPVPFSFPFVCLGATSRDNE